MSSLVSSIERLEPLCAERIPSSTAAINSLVSANSSEPADLEALMAGGIRVVPPKWDVTTSAVAIDAVRAVEQQGASDKVKIGSVDLSTAVLNQIKDGKIVFTIDQQPYLQGYYAVSILAQNAIYGMRLVGQVATGPLAIDKSTVSNVLKANGEHHGIRGAL